MVVSAFEITTANAQDTIRNYKSVEVALPYILYLGYDNPFKLNISGYNPDEISVSIDNGTISGSKGEYMIKPKEVGTSIISIFYQKELLRKTKIKICDKISIKTPTLLLNNSPLYFEGEVSKEDIVNAQGLVVVAYHSEIIMNDKIKGFSLVVMTDDKFKSAKSISSKFTEEQKMIIQSANLGDKISFEYIKIENLNKEVSDASCAFMVVNQQNKLFKILPPKLNFDTNIDTVMQCNVFQFYGNDSASQTLCEIIKYGNNYKVLSEQYMSFENSLGSSFVDHIGAYFYKDGLIVEYISIPDSSINIFKYNEKQELIKSQFYTSDYKDKQFRKKGISRDDFSIVNDCNWRLKSEIIDYYDSVGQRIKSEMIKYKYKPEITTSKWSYINKKIAAHQMYEKNKLHRLEIYEYSNQSYQKKQVYIDEKGNLVKIDESKYLFKPNICVCNLDSNNRIIEEKTINETGGLLVVI